MPNPEDCANRIKHAEFGSHNYFFSWEYDETKDLKVDWLTGRNICRRHCMDLVSIETRNENEFIKRRMIEVKENVMTALDNPSLSQGALRYIWTSGRKCNFAGCEREDLQPVIVNGWFWSGSGVRLGSAQGRVTGAWSSTGGADLPQPDNREFRVEGQHDEACLAVLNNFYADGVVWHDIACYHEKYFVCEDSDDLLEFARQSSPPVLANRI